MQRIEWIRAGRHVTPKIPSGGLEISQAELDDYPEVLAPVGPRIAPYGGWRRLRICGRLYAVIPIEWSFAYRAYPLREWTGWWHVARFVARHRLAPWRAWLMWNLRFFGWLDDAR